MLRLIAGLLFVFATAAHAQHGGISAPDPFRLIADPPSSIAGCTNVYNCNAGYNDTGGKTVRNLTINTGVKNLILIMVGQSNRQAIAPTAYTLVNASSVDNFSLYDSAVYAYADPPIGSSASTGGGAGPGHLGGRVADKFITAGTFSRVIVVPLAIGGSSAADWATGGLSNRICVAMRRLQARFGSALSDPNVTMAIEWGVGETDGSIGTSQAAYTSSVNTVLSNATACGFSGRMFVALETWLSGSTSATIRAAQAAVVNGTTILQSGDIDTINATGRQADNTHLNDTGAPTAATLIYNALHASGSPFKWLPPFAANDNWQALEGCNDNTADLCKAM
jgi:hypothetical protein